MSPERLDALLDGEALTPDEQAVVLDRWAVSTLRDNPDYDRYPLWAVCSRSSSPFLRPDHPSPWTVTTSCLARACARSYGRFSSSSTRTSKDRVACEFDGGNGLFALYRRKLAEEFIECVAGLKVVEE